MSALGIDFGIETTPITPPTSDMSTTSTSVEENVSSPLILASATTAPSFNQQSSLTQQV